MLKKERQAYILHQVNLHNKVLAVNLSLDIDVSDDTIRRDLMELADEGKIIKVHGGALSKSFHKGNPSAEQVYSYKNKTIIAQKAAALIEDGMFVLTSGGTTITELAKALPQQLHATFISGSISALMEYIKHPTIEVIAIGDKVAKNSKITIGTGAINQIRQIQSDICFLGINAIDVDFGISDNDWDVVQMKKAMIDSSKKIVCLTISEKINSLQPIKVCTLKKIDMLITELSPDDPLLKPYAEAGITVL
ncbi:MAG TPA: DeoR/GlpR family DNA-binding transcription regulator [Chitinophagaceae bacterium]|jgi:DeoR/GlpR family transcriptional regulator of sugar metabolism|nr:DeoR/GlpR family DNA-binding transcription regulator [Chitinophagaceae bacterium]